MMIAITGPVEIGPSDAQLIRDTLLGQLHSDDVLVSGAAHGVDTAGALAAAALGCRVILTVPEGKWYNTALASETGAEVIRIPGGYMARNDKTVELAELLIAFPASATEVLRSGTWATIRRARRKGIPIRLHPLS